MTRLGAEPATGETDVAIPTYKSETWLSLLSNRLVPLKETKRVVLASGDISSELVTRI